MWKFKNLERCAKIETCFFKKKIYFCVFNIVIMKNYLRILILLLILLTVPMFTESLIAQPPPPPAQEIPIDGGISALIAAGMAYGLRKVYKDRKKHEED